METKTLKMFITVAEELNFRKAADRLHMTQPPLTRAISQLEEDLGVALLNRTTRHVELTGPGLHLLNSGKQILQDMEKLEIEVRSLQKSKTGKLVMSLSMHAFHSEIPRLISSFKEQFPKISVELIENPFHSLLANLKTGKLDIAFGANEFRNPLIKQASLQIRELGLMVPPGHVLFKKKSVKLTDLEGQTLIFHGKHEQLGFQANFLEYLKKKNIHVKVYYKKSNEGCGHLVILGKGLLITSESLISNGSGANFVPFADYSPKVRMYGSWSIENKSIALKAFISFLEERNLVPRSEMDYHLA